MTQGEDTVFICTRQWANLLSTSNEDTISIFEGCLLYKHPWNIIRTKAVTTSACKTCYNMGGLCLQCSEFYLKNWRLSEALNMSSSSLPLFSPSPEAIPNITSIFFFNNDHHIHFLNAEMKGTVQFHKQLLERKYSILKTLTEQWQRLQDKDQYIILTREEKG